MRIVALFLTLVFTTGFARAAENWTQFRGPDGDGMATKAKLPVEFGEGKNVRWKTAIHGKGWSSPVVWGEQIWMTTATEDGKKLYAVCVEKSSGKIVHDVLVFEVAKPQYCHPTNSYASPTPVVEAGRLYVHYGALGSAALDTATGKVIWRRSDLPCNHWRGPGSSPIVVDNLVFVAQDGYDQQYVVALEKSSGKTLWKKTRDIDYDTDNGDRKKAYSTAALVEHNGRKQIVSSAAIATIAYDPANGDELWRIRHGGMNAAARPIFRNGMLYLMAGTAKNPLMAVRPDGKGNVTESHVVWQFGKSMPKRPSPLLVGQRIYTISDQGVASCINAKTGEAIWQKRVGGSYRSSPIYANGQIYCFSLDGLAAVFAATDEFKLLAENKFDNGCQASPAVVGDTLLVRTTKHLYCIEAE